MAEIENGARLRTDRQREIYLLSLRHGSVGVADLAHRFDVTTEPSDATSPSFSPSDSFAKRRRIDASSVEILTEAVSM